MKPDSSAKTMWAPSRAAFFYPRPIAAVPLLDTLFIAPYGVPLGLLAGETQLMQKSSDMAAMKANPEGLVDDAGNPAGSPQLRLEAVGECAAHQLLDDPTTLRVALSSLSSSDPTPATDDGVKADLYVH